MSSTSHSLLLYRKCTLQKRALLTYLQHLLKTLTVNEISLHSFLSALSSVCRQYRLHQLWYELTVGHDDDHLW